MRIKKRLAAILLMFLPFIAFPQSLEFSADSTYSFIDHLSVTIGPRPMGSPNERLALHWVVEKFKQFGADSAWVQPFDKPAGKINTNSGNAVAILAGETDSAIVIGSHIDSAGREYAGANDNASGAASVLELARIWSQRPRHYTMIFASFGGEEQGLLGSKYFVKNYPDIDKVALMISLDMTGSDDEIMIMFERDSSQAPQWLVRDAFETDRKLGINRLLYPTHFSAINNIGKGSAGSDHEPFLVLGIPAMDFTAGVNNSPIHTPQDVIQFISKSSLDQCGRLADALLQKYQSEGIPAATNGKYMVWTIFGAPVFIPWWCIVAVDVLAVILGLWAFFHSLATRLRIEKANRIRFSGLKLFVMFIGISAMLQLGEATIQLVKGLRYPWMVHVYSYLWYVAILALAGAWLALRLASRWRFSPDHTVYARRAIIVLFLFTVPLSFVSFRLMLYPALSLLLTSLAILIPFQPGKILFALASPLPLLRFMFFEPIPFLARGASRLGFQIDSFFLALLYSAALVLLMALWYLPSLFSFSYLAAASNWFRQTVKKFRAPIFGWAIGIAVIGYGIYLFTLPAYNPLWRPYVHVDADYHIQNQKGALKISGNEYFKDVVVKSDSLDMRYQGRIHSDTLKARFDADWVRVDGGQRVTHGEKDSLAIDWRITSRRPWYLVTLEIRPDTASITGAASALNFNLKEKELTFRWFAEPPETLNVAATFQIEPGASLIRKVTAVYPAMPLPIDVTSDLANVRYRTTVVWQDTLGVNGFSK
ncbi:MAG: M28 family peptidase [Candidatus Zhuqueibacterota bacterium]